MNVTRSGSAPNADALEARFGLWIASRLSEGAETLPHDISERLRHARQTALAHHAATATAPAGLSIQGRSDTLTLGSGPKQGAPRWASLATWIPVVALLAGLYLIEHRHAQDQIAAAAEIDAALLADDLPPSAYSDPGFVEFLKTGQD